ncbi:peptidylprolyl isomerase [Bifidobacterium aemilianum]|uniref:peptidylprolyl isomerase n=1 Tax=Bifidobacterium aemilianum TaxID=2493120 RepID=A0A366K7E4_9BIFI|nr:FKBP-type peptidyl-prolyl cis-trans isomerase [Bifidobacterium aemilianum]RBP97665.1 peptidylprolyl isomerase [Bifidobacterium aemilianum]
MRNILREKHAASTLLAAICSLALCTGLAACGTDDSSTVNKAATEAMAKKTGMKELTGVTASGDLGKQPKISFKAPLKIDKESFAILQEGNGKEVKGGERICMQGIELNPQDGKEVANTWTKNTPDCSTVLSKGEDQSNYDKFFKGQRLNTTIAVAGTDNSSSSSSSSSAAKGARTYLVAYTLVSSEKAMTRAEGEKVTDIPADLPKITLDDSGKPSIDPNGYKPNGKLVVQPLIKGSGKKVSENDTINAQYTGWCIDGNGKASQFDSSWDRGQSTSFSLQQVVTGWKKGLAGQTVGSQVLLVIPPDMGYGANGQKDQAGNVTIPPNATLYFVVDILHIDS